MADNADSAPAPAGDAPTRGRGGGRGRGRGRGKPRKEEMIDGNEPSNPTPAVAASGSAPPKIKEMLKNVLQSSGPILQAKLNMTWKRVHPEVALEYKTWGFERLKSFLDSMPDVVELKKEPGERDWTIYLVGSAATKAQGGGAAGGQKGAVVGGLTTVIAGKTGADEAAVKKFLNQAKLRFTIDTLVEEFKKLNSAPALAAAPPAAPTPPAAEEKEKGEKKKRERKPRPDKPKRDLAAATPNDGDPPVASDPPSDPAPPPPEAAAPAGGA